VSDEAGRPPSAEVQEALHVFGEYLSDKVAPLMALEAVSLLMDMPPAFAAREIVTWCVRQVEVQGGALALGDLLFHSARKIHMMGDFELIDAPALDRYLKALGPLLLEACPPEGREHLALGLSRLDESRQALASKVEIVHRQSGAAEPVALAAAATGQQAVEAAPRVLSAIVQGLGRLPLLLQRLEQVAPLPAAAAAPAAPSGATAAGTAPAASPAAGRAALVADAILEASLQAKSPAELDRLLEGIRRLGAVGGTDEMFRALGRSVSGWTLPAVPDVPALPEGVQVSAMRRMIALAEGPAEAGRRFREMVHAAIEQFNEGSYGRSLKMFDLARQMMADGQVQSLFVEPMVVAGHEYLAEDRVRKLAERPEGHFFLRPVLGFFRAFAPERLLDELQAESRRDRRRQLLNLLEAAGAPARAAAWEKLRSDPEGTGVGGLYFVRNLVHLLRAIPRPADAPWPLEEETDAVARLAGVGRPLFLVKESLQYLVAGRHPRAEGHLVSQLHAVEGALLDGSASAAERPVLLVHLDRVAAALARFATPRAWAALVEHALKRDASLGDPLTRLAELSGQDLSPAPTVVSRLAGAVEENLPHGVLGRLVPGREAVLTRLVAALAATRAPEARDLLESVASRFPNQTFGRDAQRILAAQDQRAAEAPSAPSFSGDLDLFGLPNLLQSLCEMGKTGVLNLLDEKSRPAATLRLEKGVIRAAQCGARQGREALFQLIERPFAATFAFVRARRPEAGGGEELPVTQLLVEGVRRHDQLQRALALVPDDASLEATGQSPSSVPDEEDYDLVVALWKKVCEGATPRDIEAGLAVDSYRVLRCLAHWVEEGALRPRPAVAA
jgi:hypothetical protein